MLNHTLLIVDDDGDIVLLLKANIMSLSDKYKVKTCQDGKEALDILEKEQIDLMILDIQMPVMNGFQLLAELQNKGIWVPTIIISGVKVDEKSREFSEFGIIDFIKKPLWPEKIASDIDEIMKNRGKTDLIKNLGLPAIMQLIEMEKRTGILTVKIGRETGRIFFKEGKLMDITIKGLSTEKALEELMNSLHDNREISIEYINHRKERKINMSLMQMVMEAARLKDEKKIPPVNVNGNNQPGQQHDDLSTIAGLLNSLKEVESYIVAGAEGKVFTASSKNYNEDVLNSGLYLWIIGSHLGHEFKMGEPAGLIYYLKARKRLIRKYNDYIIILDLKESTKFSAFKKKLDELFDKLV